LVLPTIQELYEFRQSIFYYLDIVIFLPDVQIIRNHVIQITPPSLDYGILQTARSSVFVRPRFGPGPTFFPLFSQGKIP
jgi:hypothetical protein